MTLQIQTFTGRRIDPWKIRPEDVDIKDIAHSLAFQCRFSGHVKEFYSVAQHSVYVATEVTRNPPPLEPHLGLAALLHDASEAYLGDMSRPVKHHREMEAYRIVELHVQRTVNMAFGLPPNAHREPAIIQVDRDILYWEQYRLCHRITDDCLPRPRHEIYVDPWHSRGAELAFISLFQSFQEVRSGIQPFYLNSQKDPTSARTPGSGPASQVGDGAGPSTPLGDEGT